MSDIATVKDDCTLVCFNSSANGLQQGALTRTVSSEKCDDFAFFHFHVQTLQHHAIVVTSEYPAQQQQLGIAISAVIQGF